MKRVPEIKLIHLCISPQIKHNGYGTLIFNHITEDIIKYHSDMLLSGYKFVCYCQDGAENNKFYDKFSNNFGVVERKTMNLRRYIFNLDYNN